MITARGAHFIFVTTKPLCCAPTVSGGAVLLRSTCAMWPGGWLLGVSRLHPRDIAAGSLLVEEAEGRKSDISGARFDLHGEQTLASNGHIHQAVLEILQHLASDR